MDSALSERVRWENGFRLARPVPVIQMNPARKQRKNKSDASLPR